MLQGSEEGSHNQKKSLKSNEAKPMLQAAKREAATVKSPSPKGMVKSVHVRVKRVLRYAKLH